MSNQTTQRFAYLDSLRFLAALLVLIQHLFETRPGSVLMPLVRLGPGVGGVAMFFFISGFVIPLSVGRSFDWRSFMVRRLFRIYPLFLAALALIFVGGQTGFLSRWHDMAGAPVLRWIANLALVQEFLGVRPFLGVSWTLSIELIWYGMFAASLLLWGDRAARRLDWLVPLALVLLTVFSLIIGARIPLGVPTMIYAAVIGFQCYRHRVGLIDDKALRNSILRFAVVVLIANYVAFGYFTHPKITLAQDLVPWVMSTGIFLAVILLRPLREARWLNAGPAPYLGAISYSIYLLHPIVINAADLYIVAAWQVPVALGGTVALAALTFRLIEKPGGALGRRVVQRLFARPQAPAASAQGLKAGSVA